MRPKSPASLCPRGWRTMSPPDNSGVRALPIRPWPNDEGTVTRVLMRLARPIAALVSATGVSMAWNARSEKNERRIVRIAGRNRRGRCCGPRDLVKFKRGHIDPGGYRNVIDQQR